MLQPLLSSIVRSSAATSARSNRIILSLLGFLLVLPHGQTQLTAEPFIVEPTPALRLNEEVLTTVLLVNNENTRGDHVHGRFVSLRPEVGVLTSTARTFIQEGVTTEYATQVLGTTLENGRLYAHLLKKSSRVLYDPSVVTSWVGEALQTKSLLQSHNDLFNADQPDWQDIDDRLLLEKNDFVGNTDYIGLHEIRLQKVGASATENTTKSSTSSTSSFSSAQVANANIAAYKQRLADVASKISTNKVLPFGDLPTYTVKNFFAPSGFSWDSNGNIADAFLVDSKVRNQNDVDDAKRSPKLFYNQIMGAQARLTSAAAPDARSSHVLSTITYYGFADFTTVVGNSVIVFSPSTLMPSANIGHVTSIKGEATLGGNNEHVSNVPISVTQDIIVPTYVEHSTILATAAVNSNSMNSFGLSASDIIQEQAVKEQQITTASGTLEMQLQTKATSHIVAGDDAVQLQASEKPFDDTVSIITESATINDEQQVSSSQTVLLSRPSNEDILRIYASLSSVEAARQADQSSVNLAITETETTTSSTATLTILPPQTTTSAAQERTVATSIDIAASVTEPLQSDIKILGGATTIFFEDDPFSNFIEPTAIKSSEVSTITEAMDSSENVATTPKYDDNSEDEIYTTIAIDDVTDTAVTTEDSVSATTTIANADATSEEAEEQQTTFTPQTDSTTPKFVGAVIVNEIAANDNVDASNCIRTSQVFLTQLPHTLTYYTTYLTPDDGATDKTSTSVETNVVPTFNIEQATKHYCIQTRQYLETDNGRSNMQLEKPIVDVNATATVGTSTVASTTESDTTKLPSTTPAISIRQNQEVTEPSNEQQLMVSTKSTKIEDVEYTTTENEEEDEINEEDDEEDADGEQGDDSEEEEVDLIYKTLYTTYTYLTTFFHYDTTSISSHKEVVTNVITSTLGPENGIQATKTIANLNENEIVPSAKFVVPTELESILRSDEDDANEVQSTAVAASGAAEATTHLDDSKLTNTFFTTYTYYTTIFAEGDTEIMSRTEVYTNYVTGTKTQASTGHAIDATSANEHNVLQEKTQQVIVDTTVYDNDNVVLQPTATITSHVRASQTSTNSGTPLIPDLKDYSSVTLVTDVRSSSSNGDQQIIRNHQPSSDDAFDDQISSESNTEEIIPSATLLLQTSFTTFTYYTTMYNGESTNVISRLETVTNVATETLQATKTLNIDQEKLPITYFTTFTYWTKLSKDGEITTLSREETVSNIVTPTNTLPFIEETTTVSLNDSINDKSAADISTNSPDTQASTELLANEHNVNPVVTTAPANTAEPTTFYTTYTYYTTSYVSDQTITYSRFETVTNVVTPTISITNTVDSSVELSSVAATSASTQTSSLSEMTQNVISYDNKKIIDADGISTLYFTTQVLSTTAAGGIPTEIVSKSSSLHVDEVKKALLPTSTAAVINADGSSVRQYKTGLVRLIEGTRIANATTTLYQSKVIGTVIEGRYAQIIESTSSFLIEKTQLSTKLDIAATTTTAQVQTVLQSTQQPNLETFNAAQNSIHGSISDYIEDKTEKPVEQEEEIGDDNESSAKGRYPLQSKKRTFTPVIRPFVSRNRPQFAPKKSNISPSSATIITRSDFTPTITATPALKSSGRFSSSRRGSTSSGGFVGGSSSSRRFSRPSKATIGPNASFGGSGNPSATASGGYGGARNRGSSSQILLSSSSRRISSPSRLSSSGNFRAGFSSAYAGNSRLRIRPSSTLAFGQQTSTNEAFAAENSDEEESATQEAVIDADDEENTTENNRRNQNPLLRFRRPPGIRPSGFGLPNAQRPSNNGNSTVSIRRNPLAARAKSATTTTSTTTTTSRPRQRNFQRPSVSSFQSRARPQSNLFPPRGLLQTQQQVSQDIEQNGDRKSKDDEDFNDGGDADDDSEYEDDEDEDGEDEIEDENNRRRRSNKSTKSFSTSSSKFKNVDQKKAKATHTHRAKREADVSAQSRSNFRNRFRRPKPAAAAEERILYDESEPEVKTTTPAARPRVGVGSRFSTRQQSQPKHHSTSTTTAVSTTNHRAIRPTRPTSGRSQFTLREKDTTPAIKSRLSHTGSSSFRRPQTSASSRRTPTPSSNSRRLKSYANNNAVTENTSRTTAMRARNSNLGSSSRPRSTNARGRTRNDFNADPVVAAFDGTITVTHVIPAEVTIPVVNGKVTEYKNVVTAKTSTEILGPQQYTTFAGTNGQHTTALVRDDSTVNYAGATEVTQYVLHESPTTTVIFTPTTIRGRKTSFSHVIPSTVYSVENVVSTSQPQISANAPLANILLSQLLLGNIGLPANPLLGALGGVTQAAQLGGSPATPVTEYRTQTSTYVTTLFEGMSTIVPITFQGKKILTTIFDTTAQTITATEFITETIVTTPTQQPSQQVNSLLLQQLLLQQQQQQQQLQQQQQQQQQPLPILHTETASPLFSENLQELDTNNIRVSNDADDLDVLPSIDQTHAHKSSRKKNRKSGKSNKRHKQHAAQESSVITLYVSGRRPGEFSTILSTVAVGHDQHKRQAAVQQTASIDSLGDYYASDGSEIFSEYMLPETPANNLLLESSHLRSKNVASPMDRNRLDLSESSEHTQSLESIVGDVSLWYSKTTAQFELQEQIKTKTKAATTAASEEKSKHFLV